MIALVVAGKDKRGGAHWGKWKNPMVNPGSEPGVLVCTFLGSEVLLSSVTARSSFCGCLLSLKAETDNGLLSVYAGVVEESNLWTTALPTLSKQKDCSAAVICRTCHHERCCRWAASCLWGLLLPAPPTLTAPPGPPCAAAQLGLRAPRAPRCLLRPPGQARRASQPRSWPSPGGLAKFPKLAPQNLLFPFRVHRGMKTESMNGLVW